MLLVFGAGRQVGRALVNRAGSAARGFDRTACDICNAGGVSRELCRPQRYLPWSNCAAFTPSTVPRLSPFAVNSRGAEIIARATAEQGLPIIHLSTDYVYAGAAAAPHREDEPIAPLDVFRASKAAGDAAVASANPTHLLFQVSWVFGIYGANFVKTMLCLVRQQND